MYDFQETFKYLKIRSLKNKQRMVWTFYAE
jgi:hypothetical protein